MTLAIEALKLFLKWAGIRADEKGAFVDLLKGLEKNPNKSARLRAAFKMKLEKMRADRDNSKD